MESIGGRTAAMRTSVLVWRDHLLFGTGPGALYPRLETEPNWDFEGQSDAGFLLSYRGEMSPPHPHNMYLLMLAEFGLLGTPFMLFLIGSVGWMLYSLRQRLGNSPIAFEFVTAAGFTLVAPGAGGALERRVRTLRASHKEMPAEGPRGEPRQRLRHHPRQHGQTHARREHPH